MFFVPPLKDADVNHPSRFQLDCPACSHRRASIRHWSAGRACSTSFIPKPQKSVPIITTNGVASVDVVPDSATISLGVDTERPKAADAARDNARAAEAIVAEIKAAGIDPKDIKTVSITLSPVYDETTNSSGRTKRTLRGYEAHNAVSVRLKDVTKAGPWRAN